jgi:hypothetical protein
MWPAERLRSPGVQSQPETIFAAAAHAGIPGADDRAVTAQI